MEIPENWTFNNDDIASSFDCHVRDQLPFYDLLSNFVSHIVRSYAHNESIIYDIGCSTGNIEILLSKTISDRNINYIPIDNSEQMIKNYKGKCKPVLSDVLLFDFKKHDISIMFLTLMFINHGHKEMLLKKIYSELNIGGIIIIIDKISYYGFFSNVMRSSTLLFKYINNVSCDDIIKKELSLLGVQRPISQNFISTIFPANSYEFFRFGEFAGWVIEKQ